MVAYRNFGVFAVAYEAVGLCHEFRFRFMDKRFGTMLAVARAAGGAQERGPGDWPFAWTLSRRDHGTDLTIPADAVVRGRLVKIAVERDGGPMLLRPFATDPAATPADLAERYARRWDVEVGLRALKDVLGLDRRDDRGEDVVRQEIALGSAAYDLVVQVSRPSGPRPRLPG